MYVVQLIAAQLPIMHKHDKWVLKAKSITVKGIYYIMVIMIEESLIKKAKNRRRKHNSKARNLSRMIMFLFI